MNMNYKRRHLLWNTMTFDIRLRELRWFLSLSSSHIPSPLIYLSLIPLIIPRLFLRISFIFNWLTIDSLVWIYTHARVIDSRKQ